MHKNLFKRMKKSSVVLMAGAVLLGSSIMTYGATYNLGKEYSFENVNVEVQDMRTEIDVAWKLQTDSYRATMWLDSTNCPPAQTAFRIRDVKSNVVMSPDIAYIYGTDTTMHDFSYRSQWIGARYEVKLEGWPVSGYSCYTVTGGWAPDGI